VVLSSARGFKVMRPKKTKGHKTDKRKKDHFFSLFLALFFFKKNDDD
jgi:hypothetical protein